MAQRTLAMKFSADRQTLEDLNLLGRYRSGSIFNLFNKVETKGAENLLGHFFESPMTDHLAINERSAIFKSFQGSSHIFPFHSQQLEEMEEYIGQTMERSFVAVILQTTKKAVLSKILEDKAMEVSITGIYQTLSVLKKGTEDPYISVSEEMKLIAGHPYIQRLLKDGQSPGTTLKIAKAEHLLRGELRGALLELLSKIYHYDLYIAVSRISLEKGFGYAKALPSREQVFEAEEIWHPGIEDAVRNPIGISSKENLMFLTGANMAGKSTLMKTFGINVYLAHMGFPVAAKEMNFSVKQGIYSSINVPDNLTMGHSHFYAEVLRVKEVAQQVSKGTELYVIFDELFKGTNVKDAYDATLAVTRGFADYKNCFYIISTHITEVGEVLSQTTNGVKYVYMPTIMEGSRPRYTYKITSGISTDRQGMLIIENEGILNILDQQE